MDQWAGVLVARRHAAPSRGRTRVTRGDEVGGTVGGEAKGAGCAMCGRMDQFLSSKQWLVQP